MKILLVDDEAPARQLLRKLLSIYADCEIIGEAADGFEGYRLIRELKPDVVFLDVEMPKLTGLEMLELVEQPPVIVFATAYEQYAVQAFERNAADYLLKPYGADRLTQALERIRARLMTPRQSSPEQGVLQTLAEDEDVLRRIAVKWKGKVMVVPVEKLLLIEADGDYVKLHSTEGSYLKETTLKHLERRLPAEDFVRVHRSAIVRISAIESIEPTGEESWKIRLQGGLESKASLEGRRQLRKLLGA